MGSHDHGHNHSVDDPPTLHDIDKPGGVFLVYVVVLVLALVNIGLSASGGLGVIALPVQLAIASVQARFSWPGSGCTCAAGQGGFAHGRNFALLRVHLLRAGAGRYLDAAPRRTVICRRRVEPGGDGSPSTRSSPRSFVFFRAAIRPPATRPPSNFPLVPTASSFAFRPPNPRASVRPASSTRN